MLDSVCQSPWLRVLTVGGRASKRLGVSTMRETWTFHSAGELIFGRDACLQLGEVALRLKAKRVLVVTDPILEKTGVLARVRNSLEQSQVTTEVFAGGEPEPSFRAADECIGQARRFSPDAIL